MLATQIGTSIRVWVAAANPDGSVESATGSSPDIGEWFLNSTNNALFVCTGNVFGSQTWVPGTNSALILSIIHASISQSSVTRALNTIFQVSPTLWSYVAYSVDISTSLSLTGGASGTVYLEISPSSTFASGIQQLREYTNANTGTLTIGLALTQTATANLSGMVPPGYYVRLRTNNNTGTPTYTYQMGQEATLF